MPLQLDKYDVLILNSLLKDGRKSFREISRETGITTPTVKARFTRLVNIGFIKSVSLILNFELIEVMNKIKILIIKWLIGCSKCKLIGLDADKSNKSLISSALY